MRGRFNGNLFVGDFDDQARRVYRYDLNADGRIVTPEANSWPSPSHVNGLAITADHFVFSRSNGRRVGGLVTVRPRNGSAADESTTVVKNMAQGIDWAPTPYGSPATDVRGLHMIFESTSTAFDDGIGCRANRIWVTSKFRNLS